MPSPDAPVNLYIYYQVAPGAQSALLAALTAMQRALRAQTGVAGRVMRRADGGDTWMEVYESVAESQGFERLLAELVEAHAIGGFLAPGAARHVERFVPCA